MNLIKQNWLGVLGLLVLCVGIVVPVGIMQNVLNVAGISALILYAWMARNEFFFYLELVVLLGTVLKILDVNPTIMFPVLVIAAIASFILIFRIPSYRSWGIIFGIVGVVGLIYGYATLNNFGYAIGGIGAMIYSVLGLRKGVSSALIFIILNAIYSSLSIYMIIMH